MKSRWLQACVLLCAVVVLPLGVAYAQDHEAVGKRLKAAVEAGELTGEQARAMLGTLKKAEGTNKAQNSDRVKAYLAEVRKELAALVEAGKISREDAAKRYEGAEKAIQERMAAGSSQRGSKRITREDLSRAGIEIRKAVAAGKLSEEDGRAKMAAMREMVGEQSERGDEQFSEAGEETDPRVAKYHAIEARIRAAVEAGKMSKEDAEKKLIAIRMEMWPPKKDGQEDGGIGDWIESIGERLRQAVEAGELSEEEAWAKWHAIKETQIAPKLKATVKVGKMSEEKARAIWQGIEKAEAGERLKSAVDKGEMSEEEARAKWAKINKDDEK